MSKKSETSFMEPSNVEHLPAQSGNNDSSSTVEWMTLPAATSSADETLDAVALFHSVRRHWLLALVLGLMVAVITTALCMIFLPKRYTSRALIQVDVFPEASAIGARRHYDIRTEYETFKNTQALSVRSPFVLNAAFRKSEVLNLGIYKREKRDPIRWLQDELVVYYPKNAELMEVSLTDNDPREVATMVRSVTEAYMDEVVAQAKTKKLKDLAELENMHTEKRSELRFKRDKLKLLAEQLNTTDPEAIKIQSQAAMQEHRQLRYSLSTISSEAWKAHAELAAAEARLRLLEKNGVPQFELSQAAMKDVMCVQYQRQIGELKMVTEQQNRAVKSATTASTYLGPFMQHYEAAQVGLEERQAELETQLFESKKSELEGIVSEQKVRAALIDEEKKLIEEQFGKSTEEIERLGRSSVDIEIMKSELKNLDDVIKTLNTELERARFELRNQSRIRIRQDAQMPESYDFPKIRMAMAIILGCFSGFLPLIVIVLTDVRKKRVNGTEEVSKHIGLPVIGSIPVIPSRAVRQLDAPNGAGYRWNIRLTESIDGIAAKLLRNASVDGDRAVLITSAVSGEGKTTLAIQVAMSLARAGKRTALVDFDLRRPAIDKAFQLPLDPGVCEAICGEVDICKLGQLAGIDNLTVITAGRCDRHALRALATGKDENLITLLKKEYDFVIIDGSPILPVADTRYVAQHVDSVVMSIFRDMSRVPKVLSAHDILKSFGIEKVEAVVVSPCDSGYGVVQMPTDGGADVAS